MAVFNKHDQLHEDVAHAVHNWNSHTLKAALCNVAPTAANSVFADLTEITAGNGYTAGGPALTRTSSGQTAGLYKLVMADEVITASGGTIGPFRYTDIYNDTPTSPADPLMGWYDYASSITLNDGETFTIDFNATNGLLQIT